VNSLVKLANYSKEHCCICWRPLQSREGNNAWPAKEDGDCCNDCNDNVVLAARVEAFLRALA